MKEDSKTKKQLIHELTELRSQNADLKRSITESVSAEVAAEEASSYAESIVETVREPLLVLDVDLKIVSANRNFYRTFAVTPGETIGSFIYDLGNKQWDIPGLRELLETILPEKATFDDYEVEHDFATIGKRIMLLNARQIRRAFGKERIILLAIEDITERKRLEDLLTESEERYRRLFETASDGIVLLEKLEGKITHANPAIEKMLGYAKKDIIGNELRDIGILLDRGDFPTTMRNLNKIGILQYDDVLVTTKAGRHIDTDIYLVDRARLVQCNIRDMTERKRAEEALRESEELFRSYLEYAPDAVYTSDLEGNFLYGNRMCEKIIGYRREELIGKNFFEVNILPEKSLNLATQVLQANIEGKPTGPDEFELISKEGRTIPVEISTSVVQRTGQKIVLAFVRDITKRRRAEEALRLSEEKYRWMLDNMADVITVMDMNLRFTYVSPSIIHMRGYTAEEAVAQTFEQVMTPESLQLSAEIFEEEMRLEASGTADPDRIRIVEVEQYRKDGSIVSMENSLSFMRDKEKKPVGIISVSRDITERRRAEEELRRSEEEFRSLAESMPQIVWVTRKDGWNIYFNRQWVDYTGLTLEESYGHGWMIPFHPDDQQRAWSAWENATRNNGIYSLECRLRRADGVYRWWLVRGVPLLDETGEIIKWFGTCTDIDGMKKAEKKLHDTLESLRRAVSTTIQVMVSAIEVRDPYTSGHQTRSADLAGAIAVEMGLPQDKIDGIRMAGSIHDIGKLSIPAEILSKPTTLSEIEFALIKEHARKGFEMLKDVESPWPLAETVYQHHERMDGSGYPRHLKGDDILIEARVLAVADAVEAMASHRPYRPGLGINTALDEIERTRGHSYDPAVVDVCLRLFRERGFQFAAA